MKYSTLKTLNPMSAASEINLGEVKGGPRQSTINFILNYSKAMECKKLKGFDAHVILN